MDACVWRRERGNVISAPDNQKYSDGQNSNGWWLCRLSFHFLFSAFEGKPKWLNAIRIKCAFPFGLCVYSIQWCGDHLTIFIFIHIHWDTQGIRYTVRRFFLFFHIQMDTVWKERVLSQFSKQKRTHEKNIGIIICGMSDAVAMPEEKIVYGLQIANNKSCSSVKNIAARKAQMDIRRWKPNRELFMSTRTFENWIYIIFCRTVAHDLLCNHFYWFYYYGKFDSIKWMCCSLCCFPFLPVKLSKPFPLDINGKIVVEREHLFWKTFSVGLTYQMK